jgi:hypothetical protein
MNSERRRNEGVFTRLSSGERTRVNKNADDGRRPVWLEATESFYKKLNRIAKECEVSRYDALSRGLDALLRETEVRNSALNRNIKSPSQSEMVSAGRWVRYRGIIGRRPVLKRSANGRERTRRHAGAGGFKPEHKRVASTARRLSFSREAYVASAQWRRVASVELARGPNCLGDSIEPFRIHAGW